jgi:hypothetical protein
MTGVCQKSAMFVVTWYKNCSSIYGLVKIDQIAVPRDHSGDSKLSAAQIHLSAISQAMGALDVVQMLSPSLILRNLSRSSDALPFASRP